MAREKVLSLDQASDVTLVGGKARSLNELLVAGFKTKNGFVVTTVGFNQMNNKLEAEVLAAFDKLGAEKVAVRSSAVAEDGAKDAWAGQLDTFLNVERSGLIEAVKKCWKSAGSERAKAYAEQKGLEAGAIAVLIQPMIKSDVSGVAFSVHPVTQNKDQIVIEAVRGLADSLVSGEVTPDNYVVDQDGKIIEIHLVNSQVLDEMQLAELAKEVKKIEQHFGFPVDVEWTFERGQLFILQSRPITTLR